MPNSSNTAAKRDELLKKITRKLSGIDKTSLMPAELDIAEMLVNANYGYWKENYPEDKDGWTSFEVKD